MQATLVELQAEDINVTFKSYEATKCSKIIVWKGFLCESFEIKYPAHIKKKKVFINFFVIFLFKIN